jgi:hypothetical protein
LDNDRDKQTDDRSYHEETAAEIAPRLRNRPVRYEEHEDVDALTNTSLTEVQEGAQGGTALGVTGLILSIVSLFLLPFLLSLLGIGAGFFAYRRGAVGLGRWAMGIGIISLVGTMLFAPFLVS